MFVLREKELFAQGIAGMPPGAGHSQKLLGVWAWIPEGLGFSHLLDICLELSGQFASCSFPQPVLWLHLCQLDKVIGDVSAIQAMQISKHSSTCYADK